MGSNPGYLLKMFLLYFLNFWSLPPLENGAVIYGWPLKMMRRAHLIFSHLSCVWSIAVNLGSIILWATIKMPAFATSFCNHTWNAASWKFLKDDIKDPNPLLICTRFLKNQVWFRTGFLQDTQAVKIKFWNGLKIQFVKPDFSKLIFQ